MTERTGIYGIFTKNTSRKLPPLQVARLIGDRTGLDEKVIGYAGWGDKAARFRDFREILSDAVETKRGFWWR